MHFSSPTLGKISIERVFEDINKFVNAEPRSKYKIIVGTDSMTKTETVFVSAIVIHRLGRGARYYYRKESRRHIKSLRQRIFYETALSLAITTHLKEFLATSSLLEKVDLEVHVDIGNNGETRKLIREIVGMVTGSGLVAKIKPDSFGASKVADRYTK
ncbi:MAG: ribonuclease H-like YkuK family protein [Peptococcaceae bacterium]